MKSIRQLTWQCVSKQKPGSSNGITFADIALLDIRFVKFFFEVQEE